MVAKLEQYAAFLTANDLKARSTRFVLPKAESLEALRGVPGIEALFVAFPGGRRKPESLPSLAVSADLPRGALAIWVMLDPRIRVRAADAGAQGDATRARGTTADLAIAVFGSAASAGGGRASWLRGLGERRATAGAEEEIRGDALTTIRLFGATT